MISSDYRLFVMVTNFSSNEHIPHTLVIPTGAHVIPTEVGIRFYEDCFVRLAEGCLTFVALHAGSRPGGRVTFI